MTTLKKTLIHTLELAVILGAAWFIVSMLNLPAEQSSTIITLVLGALAKYARSSESVPVKDYVNQ